MSGSSQYVTLGVDRDVFAVPVERVQEILDLRPIARLPHAPPFLLGMIDVRGRGVPVIDLRVRLGLPPAEPTVSTRILVLEVTVGGRELVLGLLADRVFEVTGLDGDRLEPPPQIGVRWRSDTIVGVGRRGDAFVTVFDLSRLFSADEASALAAPADATA
ncbi:chemotaxis protein CheW [Azospirillum sp. A39]|uniref:chemotaxis protein CheW n=1 Tax=Azospirillum sp. A39 TaxID=3462279 RepID=UPI004045DE97